MKKILAIIFSALWVSTTAMAQDDKNYTMVELSYMTVKVGHDEAFIKAIKAHDAKYHAQNPHSAFVNVINTGQQTGTYVWGMGPCMMKDIDTRPGKGAHQEDWVKNVGPHVETYGAVEYWKLNQKYSYNAPNDTASKLSILWFLDIKRGEYYRFKGIMEKIQAAQEAAKRGTMNVWDNMFGDNDGRDVALQWTQNNYASLDDDYDFKKDYEKLHGEGTWQLMLEEWEEVVVSVRKQIWENIH